MANIEYGFTGINIIHGGSGYGYDASYKVTYNNTDTTIALAASDLNTVLLVENASAVSVTLPSINAGNVGDWVQVHKMGAGNLTINRADADTIEGGVRVANTDAAETWSNIKLMVGTSTEWMIDKMLGSWSTS
jgi:hypothetical protein